MSQMDQLATREQKCKTTFNQHVSLFIRNSAALFTALTRPMLQHILALAASPHRYSYVQVKRASLEDKCKHQVPSMLSLPWGL